MKAKDIRKTFGIDRKPLECTQLFVRGMDFDHPEVVTRTYLGLNLERGEYIHFNTYDGRLGRNYTPQWKPITAGDFEKWISKKTKKMSEVDREDYPDVVVGHGESEVVDATE